MDWTLDEWLQDVYDAEHCDWSEKLAQTVKQQKDPGLSGGFLVPKILAKEILKVILKDTFETKIRYTSKTVLFEFPIHKIRVSASEIDTLQIKVGSFLNESYILGTGEYQPSGFLESSQKVSGNISIDTVLNMWSRIALRYRSKAIWYVNPEYVLPLWGLNGKINVPILTMPNLLMGREIIETVHVPILTLALPQQYLRILSTQINVKLLNDTFSWKFHIGGQVMDSDAFVSLELG